MNTRRHKRHRVPPPRNPSEAVMVHVKRLDPNPSLPRPTRFFFYFPQRTGAELAGTELKAKGFTVEIDRRDPDAQWLCLAEKQMIPSANELHGLSMDFERLAARLNGEYDGWETEIPGDAGLTE